MYIYMCVVLFVVSKILDSSELLSCLLGMGVEYCLVRTRYQRRTAAVWEGRGANLYQAATACRISTMTIYSAVEQISDEISHHSFSCSAAAVPCTEYICTR